MDGPSSFAGKETMLNLYLDTMDQAKFRCPRNVSMSKELQAHWRPMLHMTGGMTDGVHECFFISDPTMVKDSNWTCTLLARMLELAQERLQVACLLKTIINLFMTNLGLGFLFVVLSLL